MKITEVKNEEALDLLADILDPVSDIMADKEIEKAFKSKMPRLKVVKMLLKSHKKEIIEILATFDGVSVKEYDANLVQMTKTLLEILNDKDLVDFFQSVG